MKKLYQAQVIDEDTGDTLTSISSYSQEGLEEEMGKSKWTKFVSVEESKPPYKISMALEGTKLVMKSNHDELVGKVAEAESKEE